MAMAVDEPAYQKVVDPPTYHEYPGSTSSHYDTSRNPGRIWTDKTVVSDVTALKDIWPKNPPAPLQDDELGVILSATGSTRHITSAVPVPIDLVIVLDNSYSMVQCVTTSQYCNTVATYEDSRVYAMVEAVNAAIAVLVDDSPDNRVAMVQFGTGAGTIFELGQPQAIGETGRYMELSEPVGSNGTMTITTATESLVVGGGSASNAQSTNIQLGIAAGMGILADQPRPEVTGPSQRQPNVLIFTDGEPTYSSTAATWWEPPLTSGVQGPGSPVATQFYGNGFKAAMAASYLKNKINDVYNDAGFNASVGKAPVAAAVYTVGLGLDALSTDGRNLAVATLDPVGQMGLTSNTMNAGFTSAWASYLASGSVTVPVNTSESFTLNHPTGAAAKYDPTDIRYNDGFYEPSQMSDLINVFTSIAGKIVEAAPVFPVEVESGGETTSGYVTFVDPLGPFMQVRDVSYLAFCPTTENVSDPVTCDADVFTDPTVTDLGGGVVRYVFSGKFTANTVVGQADVAGLVVTVKASDSLEQGDEVTMMVPASLLPLRDSRVLLDRHGNPTQMTQVIAHPLHLYYVVGPKPGVLDALGDPDALEDGTALADYAAANTVGGQVRLYANAFIEDAQATRHAGATASWQPNADNPYYRFGTETRLFADQAMATELTQSAWDGMDSASHVWYPKLEYAYTDDTYTDVAATWPAIATTKAHLLAAMDATPGGPGVVADGGVMMAQAGLPNFSRGAQLNHAKCAALAWVDGNPVCDDAVNHTGTATMARLLTDQASGVVVALGNNGYLGLSLAAEGEEGPDVPDDANPPGGKGPDTVSTGGQLAGPSDFWTALIVSGSLILACVPVLIARSRRG